MVKETSFKLFMVLKAVCPKCLAFSEKHTPLHPTAHPHTGGGLGVKRVGQASLSVCGCSEKGCGWLEKLFQCVGAMLAQKINVDP